MNKKSIVRAFWKTMKYRPRLQSPSLRGAICFSRRARNKNAYENIYQAYVYQIRWRKILLINFNKQSIRKL